MIDRRTFLGAVTLAVLAAPRLGEAWPGASRRVARVGVLGEANPIPWMVKTAVADIECRWADGQPDRLLDLATQLVALDVDVIVALGTASARAASQSTTRVPIVVVADADLGEDAGIARLARSVANVTWLSAPSEVGMAEQRVRLLLRLSPDLRRVAVVFNAETAANAAAVARLRSRPLGASDELRWVSVRSIEDVERALLGSTGDAIDGLVVLADTLFTIHAERLVELTAQARVPAVYGARALVDAGGLMAIHGDTADTIRRTAAVVRRILAGETPASPPPHPRPHIALNVATASRLGLAVPPALLARADALATV